MGYLDCFICYSSEVQFVLFEFNHFQTQSENGLHEGGKNFQEIWESSANSISQKSEMQLVT